MNPIVEMYLEDRLRAAAGLLTGTDWADVAATWQHRATELIVNAPGEAERLRQKAQAAFHAADLLQCLHEAGLEARMPTVTTYTSASAAG